jgi:hypothetical protein
VDGKTIGVVGVDIALNALQAAATPSVTCSTAPVTC